MGATGAEPARGGPAAEPAARAESRLLTSLSGSAEVDAALDDAALVRAMLDAEAALAEASAAAGVLPRTAAAAIAATCAHLEVDLADLAAGSDRAGNPVVPLVRQLTAAVPPDSAPWVHHGATSQDIFDTALSLVAARALIPVLRDLDAAADAASALAARHRDSVMLGRTLGQQASPTTFGLKAAGWLHGLLDARAALASARAALAVQLGGPVGTLAALGPGGPDVVAGLAARLGLAAPALPWHTDRGRVLTLAAALGRVLAVGGKVGTDVGLLAQVEVGEATEGGEGRGGSSAMPHKRNPVDSVLLVAAARRGPGLVATLYAAAVQEHERAAGGWHAEWEPLLELLHVTGGASALLHRMLAHLQVDAHRMRANLDATGGLVLAEAVADRLAPALGRTAAHDAVARAVAATGPSRSFRDALLADPEVGGHLEAAGIDAALDPHAWLGSAGAFVDAALAAHADRAGGADHAAPVVDDPPAHPGRDSTGGNA